MNVTIKIDTGNAAFDDGNRDYEIARILRELADKYESSAYYEYPRKLYDINGNDVGSVHHTGK